MRRTVRKRSGNRGFPAVLKTNQTVCLQPGSKIHTASHISEVDCPSQALLQKQWYCSVGDNPSALPHQRELSNGGRSLYGKTPCKTTIAVLYSGRETDAMEDRPEGVGKAPGGICRIAENSNGGNQNREQTSPVVVECTEVGKLRRMSDRDCDTASEPVQVRSVALNIEMKLTS